MPPDVRIDFETTVENQDQLNAFLVRSLMILEERANEAGTTIVRLAERISQLEKEIENAGRST